MMKKSAWSHVSSITALIIGWMIVDAIKGETTEFEHIYMLAVGYISCMLAPWIEGKIGGKRFNE